MGTVLISGRGVPSPAPAQCLEIELPVGARQTWSPAEAFHMITASRFCLSGGPGEGSCPKHQVRRSSCFGHFVLQGTVETHQASVRGTSRVLTSS